MAYERVLAAFPRRPLALAKSRKPVVAQLLALLGFLALAGLGVASIVWYLPPLLNDTAIGDNGVEVPGSWGNWHCTIQRGVLADCLVEVHYTAAAPAPAAAPAAAPDAGKGPQPRVAAAPAAGPQQYRAIPILMFGTPDRDVGVTALRDRTNPDRIATSVGESNLTDRWITLGVIGPGLLALAIACFWSIVVGRRQQRARRELAAAPNPTVVTLTKVQRVRGAATWTFNWTAGATRLQRKESLAAPFTEPLVLDANGAVALALTDAGGRAMLLTAQLANVQLSDAERQAVLDAIQRDLPRAAPAPPSAAAAVAR